MFSTAGPDSTACDAQANTEVAPFSTNAAAVLTSVPAVSIKSSMIKHVRPFTSPITCITSATFISTRRLSTMARAASTFFAKNRARSTPPASGETTVKIRQRQLPKVIHQHRRSEQMIHRDIEKSLQLRRMQIHNQRPVRPRGGQQIGHQLRRNRTARLVLAVLPGIPEVRNHRRDAPRRSALQRIDHQQQLHQVLVHRTARRLHHEHIGAAHVLLNLDVTLAVAKPDHLRLPARASQEIGRLHRPGVRSPCR